MAIWSRCSGSYTISKTSGFSLRRYLDAVYDEVTIHSYTQDHDEDLVKVDFEFSFSLDGLAAAELIDQLVTAIIKSPGYVWSQIDSEIRFT